MSPVQKICLACGEVFYVKPYRRDNAKYCSKECYGKSQVGSKRPYHPKPSLRRRVTKNCLYCGKPFVSHYYNIQTHNFCSRSCKSKYFTHILGYGFQKGHNHSQNWCNKMLGHKFNKGRESSWKGMTFEERYGMERAKEIKEKMRRNHVPSPSQFKKGHRNPPDVEKKRIQKLRQAFKGEKNPRFGKPPSVVSSHGKGGFRKDLGHYVRSTWEANFARVLKFYGLSYEYEPRTFNLGDITYTPDFLVHDTPTQYFVEVKSFLSEHAKKRLHKMLQVYPNIPIQVTTKEIYTDLENRFRDEIPQWER